MHINYSSENYANAIPLTFIIPCAGKGTRFDAIYPKELHCVYPGMTVLDLCLEPVLALAKTNPNIRLIVVINKDRALTVAHLGSIAENVEITLVYQTKKFEESIVGAIEAALPHCHSETFLLLPDQHFNWKLKENPFLSATSYLNEFPISVIATKCDDEEILHQEGALNVKSNNSTHIIQKAEDKPKNVKNYNSIWVSIIVRQNDLTKLQDIFRPGRIQLLEGMPVTYVTGYHNVTRPNENI